MGRMNERIQGRPESGRRGMALVPALIVTALVAMMGLSMLMAHLSGARVVNFQGDEFKLTSAVESVGGLTSERIWSAYLTFNSGEPGSIQTFRAFLDQPETALHLANHVEPTPGDATVGTDFLGVLDLPVEPSGHAVYDDVHIDALTVFRHDDGDTTNLYVTVSASTKRGGDIVNPVLNRAIRLVYTIEPQRFEGFDYGVLANNVNCIFCHSVVDSTDRYYNPFPSAYGSFERIKVGTLESLMIRDSVDGNPLVNDWDSDSYLAGSLYVRGPVTDQDGTPIADWAHQSFQSFEFDSHGKLVEDEWGRLNPTSFSPAGDPPGPLENLYLDYSTEYPDMVDGPLPTQFPPPFPDDGGIDPTTGLPDPTGAGNRRVDPNEFQSLAEFAEGSISGGAIQVVTHGGDAIDTSVELSQAMTLGNRPSIPSSVNANVVLTGTESDPIILQGDVAIHGDVVISGYVKGKGTIYASGNVYVPGNLVYLDGQIRIDGSPSGVRNYGVASDGTHNALGLAAGGNILIGDYLQPSLFDPHGQYDIVSGDSSGSFNFAIAELSLFNRGEWAKAQPLLPGLGEDPTNPSTWTVVNPNNLTNPYLPGPGDNLADPSTWSVTNPNFDADWLPRYYNFGPGDEIPIYNLGELYFDPSTGTWHGDAEVPTAWDPDRISIWDPSDTTNPGLFDPSTGAPRAVVSQLTSDQSWISDDMMKLAIENIEAQNSRHDPMEIDGLLYTNNAIFGIVHRQDEYRGQLLVNGALVAADLGLLAPGISYPSGTGTGTNPPNSPFKVGLRLNYDKRLRSELNVKNPNRITIKRKLWNPSANLL